MTRLVAIVGPTASGKTDLAIRVAKQFGGEIICADSRTIYKGMDIGTAKPSQAERAQVPHHLLDIISPDQTFSAAEFKARANRVIEEIHSRVGLPILVGGSGLYVYSVIYDFQFPAGPSNELRRQLESKAIAELVQQLQQLDPEAAEQIDLKNPRRVIRAIETAGQPKAKSQLGAGVILIGLKPDLETLERRISSRVDVMVEAGFENEVREIAQTYGWNTEALTSIGYRAFRPYIEGRGSLEQAKAQFVRGDLALAKRQLTWFKRNPDIRWFNGVDQAYAAISSALEKQKV